MAAAQPGRVAVVVIRAWQERSGTGLRIRVTCRQDILVGSETIAMAVSSEEVCAHIRTWLEQFQKELNS
jgi:hypothetical protein